MIAGRFTGKDAPWKKEILEVLSMCNEDNYSHLIEYVQNIIERLEERNRKFNKIVINSFVENNK